MRHAYRKSVLLKYCSNLLEGQARLTHHRHALLELVCLLVEHERQLFSDFGSLRVCQLLCALPQQRRGLPQQLQLLIQLLHQLIYLRTCIELRLPCHWCIP